MKYGYIVMCQVSGATGTRITSLKSDDGAVLYFETREAAAAELAQRMNDRDDRNATFRYWTSKVITD